MTFKQTFVFFFFSLSINLLYSQGYLMGRFDYMYRLDNPVYAYLDESGTVLNGANANTLAGISFNESSLKFFTNDWTFGQEVGLSIHRTNYETSVTPSTTYKQQYYLMEGRVFAGKSFSNDLVNVHVGPMIAIKLQDVGFGKFDEEKDNKWFWLGFSAGAQLHFSNLFLIARYNQYFTDVNATYKSTSDVNKVHISTRLAYFTLGLGLQLKTY